MNKISDFCFFSISSFFDESHCALIFNQTPISTNDHRAFRRKVKAVPLQRITLWEFSGRGKRGFRLGDTEEQMFLLQPWPDRGSNGPEAHRQKAAEREVRRRVRRALQQSREAPWSVHARGPVLPASTTRPRACSLNHPLPELQFSHL